MIALVAADLRSRWRSIAAQCGGCFVFLLVLAGTYSAYGGATGFAKAFGGGHTPKLLSAFSGSSSADIYSPSHFLAFGFGHPLVLLLTISVAVTIGVAAVATDVETGRAELLFTAPVRRTRILDARIAGWLAAEMTVLLGALVGALVGRELSPDLRSVPVLVPFRDTVQLASLLFFVAAVAFAASARARTRGNAIGMAVGVAAGSYVLNLVALLWHPLAFARRISPFGYYSAADAADHVRWADAGVLVGAGVVLMLVARRWLAHRDLA